MTVSQKSRDRPVDWSSRIRTLISLDVTWHVAKPATESGGASMLLVEEERRHLRELKAR